MPRDIYEEYRQPLTEEEQMGMPEAEEMLAAMEREADDPNSKLKSEELWDFDRVMSQTDFAWAYSA